MGRRDVVGRTLREHSLPWTLFDLHDGLLVGQAQRVRADEFPRTLSFHCTLLALGATILLGITRQQRHGGSAGHCGGTLVLLYGRRVSAHSRDPGVDGTPAVAGPPFSRPTLRRSLATR